MYVLLDDGSKLNIDVKTKKVKYLRLKVNAVGEVALTLPVGVSKKTAEKFVTTKRDWIIKTVEKIRTNKHTVNTNEVRILGKNYPLIVKEANKNSCRLYDDYVLILNKQDYDYTKTLEKWLRESAKLYFDKKTDEALALLHNTGIKKPTISIRKMKSIWGSCSYKKGAVRYNLKLYSTPPSCVEYVILHELAHFLYANHGAEFKNFLSYYMPNWKEYRRLLSKEII